MSHTPVTVESFPGGACEHCCILHPGTPRLTITCLLLLLLLLLPAAAVLSPSPVPHGNHHDMVWHDTSYGGWGRKLRGEDDD
jgi:hypothetical protein